MSVPIGYVFSMFAAVLNPSQAGDEALTLDQAIKIGEKNAFAIRLQQATINKNRHKVSEAQGGLMPRLSTTLTYTRNEFQNTGNLGGNTVVFQPFSNQSLVASLQLPLDVFGIQRKIIDANRAIYLASKVSMQAQVNDTHFSVRQAFIALLRSKGALKVQEQALINSRERKQQADQLLAAKQIAAVDVLRLATQVAQNETDLIGARNAVMLAKNALNQAMSRTITSPVDAIEPTGTPSFDQTADAFYDAAKLVRPEARAFTDQITAANKLMKVAGAGLTPTVNLGVNYNRVIDGLGFGQRAAQTAGTLTLSIPIFDGGITRAKVRQAEEDLETLKIQNEQFLLSVSAEVRSAVTNFDNSKKRMEASQRQLELATEVFRLSKIRRDAGEGTTLEIVDAQTQLVNAQNSEIQARYDLWLSYAQLQRAVGNDDVNAAIEQATKMKGGK